MTDAIESRVPAADYFARPGLNISRLKELRTSPQHFRYFSDHPKETQPMTLGVAAHCLTLEPENFTSKFAIWTSRTASGRMSPRTGKAWETFVAEAGGRTVITAGEHELALGMATAVRNDPVAAPYLESGEPEVTLQWDLDGRPCKGRVDWLTLQGGATLVGLKTTADIRPWAFQRLAARLGYHLQWAWYGDGYECIRSVAPVCVEIVVESEPPHAVIVYEIPPDVIAHGRSEYQDLLQQLAKCEASGQWPGPATEPLLFELPAWATDSGDDLTGLELENAA